MTGFEFLYLCAEPFCPPLQRNVRAQLKKLAAASPVRMEVLDVGGRLSNYTIGVPANITVTDLPRNTPVQQKLHLGATESTMDRLVKRRSNVTQARYDDMTQSCLPSDTYDCAVAVEVLEHTEEDEAFLAGVCRVLKPGRHFLMTTPNGEAVKNVNPDHKRHYTHAQLTELLKKYFVNVNVEYAVQGGRFYGLGLRSWSLRNPLRTAITMVSASISGIQSNAASVRTNNRTTHQLIAWATKPESGK